MLASPKPVAFVQGVGVVPVVEMTGPAPTLQELADALGMPVEELAEAERRQVEHWLKEFSERAFWDWYNVETEKP